MLILFLSLLLLATKHASGTFLYVASYNGFIYSLNLTLGSGGSYDLTKVFDTNGSAPNPSWLTLDSKNKLLYAIDEGLAVPNGSLTSYKTTPDGALTFLHRVDTIAGPVNGALFPNEKAIALAHYGGGAVSSFKINHSSGALSPHQNITFNLTAPGPNKASQSASHPHQALVDPTGWFVLVPDLGADLIRIFCIEKCNTLTEHEPLKVPPGSGPRHVAFKIEPDGQVFLYAVGELSNDLWGWKVSYNGTSMQFTQFVTTNTFGGLAIPNGAAAGEIAVTPDQRFLLVSNRNDSTFVLPNVDPNNQTQIISDSLAVFEIKEEAPNVGELTFGELFPAGGTFPRQFSISANGALVAVGLQNSDRIVILQRNVTSGTMGPVVAEMEMPGAIVCLVWDE